MEATAGNPPAFATLDGAYWLTPGCAAARCVSCTLLRTRASRAETATEPEPEGEPPPDGDPALLELIRQTLTEDGAGRVRAVMLACSVGTVLASAITTLRA